MNYVLLKNISIIYISKGFRGFCVSRSKTRVLREQNGNKCFETICLIFLEIGVKVGQGSVRCRCYTLKVLFCIFLF